jgi:uncharacterized protein (TIGR00369 family)
VSSPANTSAAVPATDGWPDGTPRSGADVMRAFVPISPFLQHLGIRVDEMRPDEAVLTLPYRPEHATMGTMVHGGAIATLIDVAGMVAAWSGAEAPANQRGSTVGMTVSYLAAANGEDLRARARLLRRGRSLAYVDIEVVTASGALAAKGLVTYKLG